MNQQSPKTEPTSRIESYSKMKMAGAGPHLVKLLKQDTVNSNDLDDLSFLQALARNHKLSVAQLVSYLIQIYEFDPYKYKTLKKVRQRIVEGKI